MHRLLLRVFEGLEQENLRYCVLRGYEKLDHIADSGDIDLLVEESQLAHLHGLLSQLGFVHLPGRGHAPHHFFVTYDQDADLWLKLDVVTEVAFGRPISALRTTLATRCLNNRRRYGPVFIPSPEDELVTLLLHCVLDKGEFTPRRRRRLKMLRDQVTDERYLSKLLVAYWSPAMTWPQLAAQIDAGNWAALLAERRTVTVRLAAKDVLGTLGRMIGGLLVRRIGRWAGFLRPRVPMVMVSLGQPPEEHATTPPKREARPRGMRRLKVAYIMSRFPKLTETFILYEMLALEEQGVQVELYPLLREHPPVMHPEAAPLVERAHFQPFLSWRILRAQAHFLRRKPRAYLGTLWALLRGTWGSFRFFTGALAIFPKTVHFACLMAAEGITHVHAHFASHPAAAAFVIHRLVGIPYSFTAHGSDLHRDRHMLREKVAEAAFVVTISNCNKEMIIEECGEQFQDRIHVIHCGVDTQVFQPRPSGPSGPLTILCIGTLHEVKGQSYLIEACRLLRERGIDFACYFIGDGPNRAALARQIAQARLTDRIHLLGPRTRGEIASLLHETHVLAVPSVPTSIGRREGIPVVLMEALASGVPVVASHISGIPELVEDERNGLLVPPRDARALADALERLHGDPALRWRLGQAGRDKVLREFDLHKNAAVLARRFAKENPA